jgi:TMEM175 potassium channel family protein
VGGRLLDDDVERGASALGRLSTFSDAVFAIAMTLLVLDIPRPPESRGGSAAFEVVDFLTGHKGKFIAYVISFWVIALFWMGHHRLFRYLRAYDLGVVLLNLALLFCIAFLPFPSAVLGDHGGDVGSVVFYALCISVTGMTSATLTWYAVIHRRFTAPLPTAMAWYHVSRGLVAPVVFLISIPVAFVNTYAAMALWMLSFVLQPIARRIAENHSEPVAAEGA